MTSVATVATTAIGLPFGRVFAADAAVVGRPLKCDVSRVSRRSIRSAVWQCQKRPPLLVDGDGSDVYVDEGDGDGDGNSDEGEGDGDGDGDGGDNDDDDANDVDDGGWFILCRACRVCLG